MQTTIVFLYLEKTVCECVCLLAGGCYSKCGLKRGEVGGKTKEYMIYICVCK
ncbi:hypothetical protein BDB00DRAFT_844421 [Zychaea mexicana]|uniref:uncharacterized protein n=1 Tax=Zychaea mexicana TaxID=64656 RepID=UPI0022FE39DE|nr:uncharacterized protein BDB00DRAFT_844421 [Zychaea mexicana]KAI9489225.1 hypothetical protein BDB00DRAFT_844421 [Zychaea mexicana]